MNRRTGLAVLSLLSVTQLAFYPHSISGRVDRGNRLYGEGKWPEALTAYNDAQLESPAQPEIFFNMGNVFYRQKKYGEAADAYRKAMEKGDRNLEAKAYYNIGNAFFQEGLLREALDAYKQALERAPDDVDAKYNIEYTERKIKEMLSQAQTTMEKALRERAEKESSGASSEADAASGGLKDAWPDKTLSSSGKDSSESPEKKQAQEAQAGTSGKVAEEERPKNPEDSIEAYREEEPGESKPGSSGRPNGAGKKAAASSEAPGGEGASGGEPEDGELSGEEAERFLSAFESQQQNLPPLQTQRPTGGHVPHVEKDW